MHAAFALSRIGPEAIPPLITALSAEDVSKRGGAAMALGDMGPAAREAAPALIANLGNPDPEVQRTVGDALAQIGPETVKPVAEALGSAEARTRQGAALALGGLGKAAKEAGPRLADVTEKETDASARIAELGALSRVGVEAGRSVPLLVDALKSGDDALRHAAVNGLALVRPAQPAVQALQALLSDNDAALRQRAAHTLSRLGSQAAPATAALIACAKAAPDDAAFTEALAQVGEAALPPILQELSAPAGKDTRQDWIFRTLRDMGSSAMPALVAGLTSPLASVRAAAVRALGDIPIQAPATVKTISALTTDPEPDVRAAALRTLATVRTEREASAAKLEAALKGPAPQVRKAAAAGLVSLGAVGKISVPGLIELMADPDPATQTAAVRALGDLGAGAASAIPLLVEQLGNAALQSAAAEALGKIGAASEPAVPKLLALAEGKDRELGIVSMQALGGIGRPAESALPVLYAALKNDDREIRSAAFQALPKIEPDKDKLLPIYLSALEEPTRVRRIAAQALKQFGEKARPAVPALLTMLDRDMDRPIALEALRAIHVREVPPLLTALNHKDATVRAFACESLGELGPEAHEATSALEQKAQTEGEPVRSAAKKALERINAKS